MIHKLTPLLAILLLLSCYSSVAAESSVVATVGESEVKEDDIKPLLENLSLRERIAISRDPAALNELVRSLIVQQLVYKEALSKKWEQQPQVVAQLERLRHQAISQSYLQSVATPPEGYPSSSELQAAYEALRKNNSLQVQKQYHLAQIYISCPQNADKTVEAKALSDVDAALKAIKAGDFSVVAKSLSQEVASAQKGGDLGWLSESQIQPEIRTPVMVLAKGAVTEPIRMNDGWHIVKVVEVRDPYTATLDEVKASLTNELRSQRTQMLSKAYLAKLLQQNPVTLNEIAISKLLNTKSN